MTLDLVIKRKVYTLVSSSNFVTRRQAKISRVSYSLGRLSTPTRARATRRHSARSRAPSPGPKCLVRAADRRRPPGARTSAAGCPSAQLACYILGRFQIGRASRELADRPAARQIGRRAPPLAARVRDDAPWVHGPPTS